MMIVVVVIFLLGEDQRHGGLPKLSPFTSSSFGNLSHHQAHLLNNVEWKTNSIAKATAALTATVTVIITKTATTGSLHIGSKRTSNTFGLGTVLFVHIGGKLDGFSVLVVKKQTIEKRKR